MAISKRLRFEILRRDNHTCYYCGRRAPEVEITIDHVLPQALGGTDEASNLVACCRECNGGKTSIAPDSPLVARVDEDAIRWSAAMQAAITKAETDHEALAEYRAQFLEAWNSYKRPAELDENWRVSIETFRTRGLPIEMLIEATHRAMAKASIGLGTKFRYMCGIAWNRISEIEKHARSIFTAEVAGDDAEERTPTLKEEILPLLGQEAYEAALAEVREWHEDYDNESEVRTEEQDEHDAIISALWSLDGERSNLTRAVENLLRVIAPSTEVSEAFRQAGKLMRDWGERDTAASSRGLHSRQWYLASTLIIDGRAERFMESLTSEERDEWLLYASELNAGNPWAWDNNPTEAQLLQRAGKVALEVEAGWRFPTMCFGKGQHISRCPLRGTTRIAVEGCVECDLEPLAAEVGLLACDVHVEIAIDKGLVDGAGHKLPVTDFVVLPQEPEAEVPF